MLDRSFIRQNPEAVRTGALAKGVEPPLDEFLRLDEGRRKLLTELETQQAQLNRISKEIGALMAQGKKDGAEAAKAETRSLKDAIAGLEDQERQIDEALRHCELQFPNLPHESVPVGKSVEENVVVREWGEKPQLDHDPKPHWEIAEELSLLDPARGAKVAGSGFMVYTGQGARLQRALFNWMIDHQTLHNGYQEVYPPFLVNRASLIGTGQLPKFEEDLYKVEDDLFLIPTAEVPVTNLFRDEILEGWQLPLRLAAYSGCFRREAGAAGKDTRGLLRMHQFDKVELVKVCLPESSYDELESLVTDAESVLQALGLHYRVVLLCSGDMSFSNTKCYDLEVWSPGVEKYLEISSCSNFEAFDGRRAGIRFRRAQGDKPEFAHILNGSGLATPRLFSALLETYYRADTRSVELPAPLRPYVRQDSLEAPLTS